MFNTIAAYDDACIFYQYTDLFKYISKQFLNKIPNRGSINYYLHSKGLAQFCQCVLATLKYAVWLHIKFGY